MYNDRRNPVVHTRHNRLLREIRGRRSEKGFKWPGKPQPSRGAVVRRRRNNNNDNNNNDNDNDNMRSRPDRQSRTGFLVEQYYYLLLCEGTTALFTTPTPFLANVRLGNVVHPMGLVCVVYSARDVPAECKAITFRDFASFS